MARFHVVFIFVPAFFLSHVLALLNYPSPLISRLEHLLVDTDGAFKGRFKDAITPCSNYVSGAQTLGRQTSAQWLRVAFHDYVTARVDKGTGGIDASIGFETLRAEDSGSAFNDSFAYWAPFVDSQTSMADLVALGTVTSLGNCGGLKVPYRGGRIDATGEGEFGVPEPDTSLEETLEEFANAGFNARDAIGLTACGHSLGNVHNGGFPHVVNQSAITPNNTGGGVHFDSTPTVFDINVVHEYLGGYGQLGGALVTSFNETSRSDLRLFESDGNATMKELGQSTEYFFDTCAVLFERMLNTVPKEVVLSDVITPIPIKPVNVSFDLVKPIEGGKPLFTLSGYIRHLAAGDNIPSENITLSTTSSSPLTASPLPNTGSSIWGTTTFYPFTIPLDLSEAASLPSALTVSIPNAGTQTFRLQPEVFTSWNWGTYYPNSGIVAAVANPDSLVNVTAIVRYPVSQQGTLAPRIHVETVTLQRFDLSETGIEDDDLAGYALFNGTIDVPEQGWLMATVDVEAWWFNEGKGFKRVVDEYNRLSGTV